MRVGWGFDAHRIGGPGPMKVGGIVVAEGRGLVGTSDADVALHAVADALLGAAALGDMGTHFPSSDERWVGADSATLLAVVVDLVAGQGLAVDHLDVTVISSTIRIAPFRDQMRSRIAMILGIDVASVSVKATTTDGMGFIGRDEGVAAVAVATVSP